MLKKIAGIIIVTVLALTALNSPVTHAAAYQYAVVKADSVNVRANPGLNAKVIGKLNRNEQVKWTAKENGWVKIVYGSTMGWVSGDYLSITAISGTATGSSINIRSKASLDGKVTGKLNKGTKVTIQSETDGWYYIQYAGITGWVSKQYISTGSQTETAASQTLKNGNAYYVNATKLNIRSIPSSKGNVVGKLTTNEKVSVTGISGNWASVSYGNMSGWVSRQYLADKPKETAGTVKQAEEKVKLLKKSNIRTGPGTNHSILATSQAGTIYTVIGGERDWYKLRMANGETGWIASWLVGSAETASVTKENPGNGLKGKTIVLDAGHGGKDPGASGQAYKEKTLALGTVLLAADLLKSAGANVILSRADDTFISLQQRVNISNSNKTDAFVSVHYNSGTDSSSGIITFYNKGKDEALASAVQKGIVNSTGLKDSGTGTGDFYVLKHNTKPAVLVELGFLSNPTEEMKIGTKSHQQKSAQGLYNGLLNYFN